MNIQQGIENTGDPSRAALEAVLERINADVIGLQEIRGSDLSGNPSKLEQLASRLGCPYIFIPNGRDFDFTLNNAIISKYPFSSTFGIDSPNSAKDVTRTHAAAIIDVPGTENDPLLVSLHLKCCLDPDDPLRRAVDLERLKFFLDDQNITGSDNVFVLGDFNLIGSSRTYSESQYNALTTLPSSYDIGDEIPFPVVYHNTPAPYFNAYSLIDPMPRQQNGTTAGTFRSGSILDYLMISEVLSARGAQLEIYNSALDSSFSGLPKSGNPLSPSTSLNASDHFPVFGDFQLDPTPIAQVTITRDFLLTFETVSGQSYRIQTSRDLDRWLPYQTVSGTGASVSLDIKSGDSMRFFRVQTP